MEDWTLDNVGTRVSAVLKAINRSQRGVARILGVHYITVNRWVCGKTLPDQRSRAALSALEEKFVDRRATKSDALEV